jgi:aspartyl-tRNA(Asn)/glutamyl-tRNA(Gln) amidotransferase subunit B
LPELPAARFERFMQIYGLSPDDAATLTAERGLADRFEEAVGDDTGSARGVANWIINDGLGIARTRGLDADQLPFSAGQLRELMDAVAGGELTMRAAKELLPQLDAGQSPRAAAKRLNLLSLDDTDTLRTAVATTLAAHPAAVADYRGGKKAAIGRLIGETIKATGGRANPDAVRALLVEALETPGE